MFTKLRRLSSETAVYGVSTVLGRFLTFLLTPIYTHVVTPAELGEVVNLYAWIAFINVLYSFGLESAFFRFFVKDDADKSRRVFSAAFIAILCISGSFSLIIGFASAELSPVLKIGLDHNFLRVAAAIAFFDALALIPFAALRMSNRARHFALAKFALIVVNVAANIWLVVVQNQGVHGIFAAGLLSSAFGFVILLPEIKRFLRWPIDRGLLRPMFRFGLPTVPSAVAAIMLQLIDRPILKSLAGDEALGIYQTGYRLAIPMMIFVTVFDYAWRPFFLQEAKSADASLMFARVLTYFTLAAALLFLLVSFFIEFLVREPVFGISIIDERYWGGLFIIPIVMAGYYFNGVFTNFVVGPYLQKKSTYLALATGIAALVNLVLNLALIPSLGILGAAWATLGAYFVAALVLYLVNRRIYPVPYEWGRLALVIAVTVIVWWSAIQLSADLTLAASISLRLGAVAAFFGILTVFGFFKTEELHALRSLIKLKSKT